MYIHDCFLASDIIFRTLHEALADLGFFGGGDWEPQRAKQASIEGVWAYLARGGAQNDIKII